MAKVFISGSSRGIGAAIARRVVKSGFEVVLHGRKESEALLSLSKELKSPFICFDVADTNGAKKELEKFTEPFFGVVLNAGIADDGAFPALSEESWKNVINTNLNSFYNILNPLIMSMARAKKGRIVTISSVSGILGNRGQSNYSAAKAGLIGASKSLAIELASRNITVNVVAPGLIMTDMIDENLPLDEIKKMIPANRFGSPMEVAGIVNFLLSDEASYITRQVIGVNGGMI
ncbi:3-oxoacyl-[acyl-carrier-protein] reductase [Campylobacter hyointestinalis]|uniref:3-oxoacyl-[acyl-carrier-protein] reductase n=1 Tax=Campylobacter hyointestinalis subsp. hyointestinalis TaxID=91352 RepID=A0A0S4R7U6_CAMHY|nr:3-oxoacyl-ACP reductase FabG [Campylobacter hyointestinalis]CUU70206.1 3-oxoacyl-[acyl-carrier-protein] reductase [Campylobacter hyointestinalis]CUU70235.1 3-oxoacyl-[acyl-carrier-protein] reductase [Campylobacter hyointestinalis subsp. hyointestinalis]